MADTSLLTANLQLLLNALQTSEARCAELRQGSLLATGQGAVPRRRVRSGAHDGARTDHSDRHAAVVCWDVSHNPVGRAHVLYDLLSENYRTTLVGPNWSRFGRGLWRPLRQSGIDSVILRCKTLMDFYPQAILEASRRTYDLIYVCKPRLPSLFLGFLMKEASGCPLILDIDDCELSFFGDASALPFEELSENWRKALVEPYEALATRYCETLITHADAITVSNVALRKRYGGTIVRHARDEQVFDPHLQDRAAIREKMQIRNDEFAFVFIGTVRPHKGLMELVAALNEINDEALVLHIVGDISDPHFIDQLALYPNARIKTHPICPFEAIPAILAAADCIPLLQDADSAISKFQIPAKLSDALALGVPVLATDVAPFKDLADFPGIVIVPDGALQEVIRTLAAERRSVDPAAIRSAYLAEFSSSVNRTRVELIADEARRAVKPFPPAIADLRALMEDAFVALTREQALPGAPIRADDAEGTVDVAFFWKQNDTLLYGRRSDMIAKYLLKSGRVGRILYFDAPISVERLRHLSSTASTEIHGEAGLVLRNTFARSKMELDQGPLLQRSFIYREDDEEASLDGVALPTLKDYPGFVEAQMREAGFRPENTLAWVCPVFWDFDAIQERIAFRGRVGDLIDDQRAWDINPRYRLKLDAAYRKTLAGLDVVFTNCEPVAAAFSAYHPRIHVVPNGAETFESAPDRADDTPEETAPVIGYVGNMRDRIDWALIEALAVARPNWAFRFAGSIGSTEIVQRLERLGNVKFLGVIEYPRLPEFLARIDVAIVPHTLSALTARMNPLKIYNYLSAGLPVVSTPVPNVSDLERFVRFAEDATGFVAAIERCLAESRDGRTGLGAGDLETIGWEARVRDILAVLEPLLEPCPT